ncbi:hypothetical protein M2322_000808 [Rhodoblastus acidophilus]|nr:hypothetical protein [Rhodoblastus acidophilus]
MTRLLTPKEAADCLRISVRLILPAVTPLDEGDE